MFIRAPSVANFFRTIVRPIRKTEWFFDNRMMNANARGKFPLSRRPRDAVGLGLLRGCFRAALGSFPGRFGVISGSFWGHFRVVRDTKRTQKGHNKDLFGTRFSEPDFAQVSAGESVVI